MMHRWIFLVACVGLGGAGAFGIACSSPSTFADGGQDDASMTDQMTATDTKPPMDGGMMAMKCPNYPVQGPCDLVAQDCPSPQECVRKGDPMMGYTTECAAPKTGSIPKGGMCSADSQCVPGTECQMGRCAPHCCEGDDTKCGISPDSKPGICNLIIVDSNNKQIGRVCTYSDSCKPFKIAPCAMGSTCLIQDMSGAAKCTQINPQPGKDEKQNCSYANECKDGLYCINNLPDGGGACTWGCYIGPGPYDDAGLKTKPPGQGGCPMGQSCKVKITGLPNWFGVCAP